MKNLFSSSSCNASNVSCNNVSDFLGFCIHIFVHKLFVFVKILCKRSRVCFHKLVGCPFDRHCFNSTHVITLQSLGSIFHKNKNSFIIVSVYTQRDYLSETSNSSLSRLWRQRSYKIIASTIVKEKGDYRSINRKPTTENQQIHSKTQSVLQCITNL